MLYLIAKDISSTNYGFWISKDNGLTFEKLMNSPSSIVDLFSDDDGNIYIQNYQGSFVSYDFGKSFKFFASNPKISYSTYISNLQHLYAFNEWPALIFLNSNKLDSGNHISGKVFNDEKNNCLLEFDEISKSNIQVNVNGKLNTFSNINGTYNIRLPDGVYDFTAIAPNPLWESCLQTNIIVNANHKENLHLNLGLFPKVTCPYLFVQIHPQSMRRCFDNDIFVSYCNEGTAAANNTSLIINLSDELSYQSSSLNLKSQNGNDYIFDLGNIPSGYCGTLKIITKLSCNSEIGGLICTKAKIKSNESCSIKLYDLSESKICTNITGSFDPNDKKAFIDGVPANGYADLNQDIEYLVSFQNTGTDTAFRIVVVDKIPEGYNINTLKPLNSSHPYSLEIEDERRVKFIFDPIMLPDSNINEPASHGFIAFKISPKQDLPYGTKLDNTADIYFDFNPVVTTNTCYLTVSNTTQSLNILNGLKLNYYPNPTKGGLTIQLEGDTQQRYTIKVSDILGKELVRDTWNGSNYELKPKTQLFPGIYFMDIEDNNGKHGFGKFVVE